MNLKNLFNYRNKNFARLTEGGDYLGRRLRENLVIFDIDDGAEKVTFVTESNHLISCDYKEVKGRLTMENFEVEALDKITSDEAIDNRVEKHVHKFMESLTKDRYDNAEINFDKIVESFSMRAQIEDSRKKLNKKLNRFTEAYNIQGTKAYKKFHEALPLLKKFLKENGETLSKDGKLVEGLRLSKVVGDTYDLPRISIQDLKEEFVVVPTNSKKTLYEMVCDKELVRKELLEAKESFSRMWMKNDHITGLASHIYSKDGAVNQALKEAVAAVPYLALSNKVDLVSVMDATYQVTNPGTISQKDIQDYVNKIYEFKKPLKRMVVETLNAKYGVNIQSLRFVPSFKGLAEVQSELLGVMSENCEVGILADVLKEFSTCLARKGGVQVLDVANTLANVMAEANFHIVDVDEDFHMKKLTDFLTNNLEEAQYYGDDDKLSNDPGEGSDKKKGKKDKDWGGNKGDIKAADRKKDDDSDLEADEKGDVDYDKAGLPKNNKTKKGKMVKEDEDEEKGLTVEKKKLSKKQKALDTDGDGDIEASDLKKLRKEANFDEDGNVIPDKEKEEEEETSEEDVDAEAEADEADQVSSQANNEEWSDLVTSLEDVTKAIDLDFDAETEDEEDENQEAEEGEEPTPQEGSPA